MKMKRRHFVLLGALMGTLGIALFLGASQPRAALIASGCAGDGEGKPLCVTVTGLAQASRTPSGGPEHYLTHSVTVSNPVGATSNLTNLNVTIEWTDPGSASPTSPTSDYRPLFSDAVATASDPFYCTKVQPATTPPTLTCTTPKSLRPGESFSFGPLVFRTATNLAVSPASETTLLVKASTKESSPPPKKGSDNLAFVEVPNTTTYEGFAYQDVSEAGAGITTTLATALPGVDGAGQQHSTLPVPAANAPARGLFQLIESSSFTCPTALTDEGYTCLTGSEQVTTETTTGFGPVNLRITYTGDLAGTNENDIAVLHARSGGATVLISDTCSGDLGLPSDWNEDNYPTGCLRAEITRLPGDDLLEIDVWDHSNGGWVWGS